MTDHFGWLHLTDLHFGQSGQGPLWPNVREAFFEDLKRLHDLSGPWHAVFFTGDLSFSGKEEEFNRLHSEVLERLWQKLAEMGSANVPLFAVPGNHDLARPDPSAAVRELIDQTRFQEIANDFWTNKAGEHRQVVTKALANYDQWWRNTPLRPQNVVDGELPGDFVSTVETESGRKIGVMGLNSTYLQLTGQKNKGHLQLDLRQTTPMCLDIPDWIAQHDASLLLTHQGPDWLSEDAQGRYREINPAGRFSAHLYGHMHENQLQSQSTGGGKPLRHWQASSIFGMEKFGEPPTTRRAHGYAAGRIEFEGNQIFIRYWPRTATQDQNGWRLYADNQSAVLVADEGTQREPLPLHRRATSVQVTNAPAAPQTPGNEATPEERGVFGRRPLIDKLASALTLKPLVLVHGMRGNGKTTVINEAARMEPLCSSQRLRLSADTQLTAERLYQQLAHLLGDTAEVPRAPAGGMDEIIAALRRKTPAPKTFWLWIEHAHRLIADGKFRDPALAVLLMALGRSWPGQVRIILEFREHSPKGLLGADAIELEVPGLDKDHLKSWLETANPAWKPQGDDLKRLFGWLGGGHGHLAHPHAIELLIEVAKGHGETPMQTLKRHLGDYERKIADVLFDDLYGNVLTPKERTLIDTLALYRDAIPHDHADYLERLLNAHGAWDALCHRRLLAADAQGSHYYLHGFIADMLRQRLGYAAGSIDDDLIVDHPPSAQPLHKHIASCWQATLGGSRRVSPLNINRALNVLYHLCAAGDAERLDQIAVELLGPNRDWVITQLDLLERRHHESGAYKDQRLVLEYWSRVAPDDPKVWRFLGSAWRRSEGWQSARARHAFKQACELSPAYPDNWSNYGRACLAGGRETTSEFLTDLDRHCPDMARDGHVKAVQADALAALGRDDDAFHLRREQIDAHSANPAFYADQAKAHLLRNEPDKALAILDLARQHGIASEYTEAIRADVLAALGRDDDAFHLRREQIDANSTNPVFYNDQAKAHLRRDEPDKALAILDLARQRRIANEYTEAIREKVLAALKR